MLVALLALLLSGCNTIRGAGRDIERAGEVIQGRSAQVAPVPMPVPARIALQPAR